MRPEYLLQFAPSHSKKGYIYVESGEQGYNSFQVKIKTANDCQAIKYWTFNGL